MIAPVSDFDLESVDRFFSPSRFAVILFALIAISFWNVLTGIDTFFFRDYALFGYPLAYYHRQSFWAGELPLWNPLNDCGVPFLAQWNTLALYPFSFIYLLLPLPWALSFFCLCHLFLGGMGMYFLARHWAGSQFGAAMAGVAFSFSGLALSSLKWPNNIAGLGLMPWVILAAREGWLKGKWVLPVAAVLGAFQFLSGAPEIILLTWILLAAAFIHDFFWGPDLARIKIFGRALGLVVLVTSLAAAQLLPFFDLLRESQRDVHFADSTWAMPWTGWANFIVPLFYCFPSYHGVFAQANQYWISSYYSGIGILALGCYAAIWSRPRVKWILVSIAIFGLAMALGDGGIIYNIAKKTIPIFGLIRFPIKFVVLPCFAFPLLASLAISTFYGRDVSSRSSISKRGGWILSALSATAVILLLAGWQYAKKFNVQTDLLWNGISRVCFLLLLGGALSFFTSPSSRRGRIVTGTAVLMIVWLDLLTHAPWENPTVPASTFASTAELNPRPRLGEGRAFVAPANEMTLDHILPHSPIEDVLMSRLALFCDCNLLDAIPKVNGFYSLYLRAEGEIEDRLYSDMAMTAKPLLEFLGVSQISQSGKVLTWISQTNHLPWVTAGQRVEYLRDKETLAKILDPKWDPRKVVYLSAEQKAFGHATNTTALVVASRFSRNKITMTIEATAPSLVVVAQSYHHGWHAYYGTREVPIFRANHAFQAFEVPAGRTEVRCSYEQPGLVLGAWISFFALGTSVYLLRKQLE